MKTNRCKKMRICNTALKLARFIIHMMKRKNVLNSRNILQFLRPPEVTGHFKKNSTSISQKKCTGYCGEFKGK